MNMITNPHLLPKVRSKKLKDACAEMPCTLRIASFAGLSCSPQDTVVGAHLPVFGKGTSTKVSDLYIVAACHTCHDLLDFERNKLGLEIMQRYPQAFWSQVFKSFCETQARWVQKDLIVIPNAEII
jgi:hypothetical protein